MRRVEHDQHHVGVGERFQRLAHADAFGFVERVANSGGVHQMHRNSTDGDGLGDQVARGAGRGGDDGALVLDQPVEQARLADVGTADDGERQAFVHDFAVGEAGEQLVERRVNVGDARQNLRVGNDGDIVFGEVDAGFHHRDQVDELLLDRLEPLRQRAFELPGRDLRLIERLRIDQVADGLGLGEIDAAVEEGAHGELAGLGEARSASQRHLHHVPQDDGRAVTGDLDYVVGGVRVRLGEIGDDDFVDAVACGGINQLAEVGAVRL